jgi:hypothetical protein
LATRSFGVQPMVGTVINVAACAPLLAATKLSEEDT